MSESKQCVVATISCSGFLRRIGDRLHVDSSISVAFVFLVLGCRVHALGKDLGHTGTNLAKSSLPN